MRIRLLLLLVVIVGGGVFSPFAARLHAQEDDAQENEAPKKNKPSSAKPKNVQTPGTPGAPGAPGAPGVVEGEGKEVKDTESEETHDMLFGSDMGPHDPEAQRQLTESARTLDRDQKRLQEIFNTPDPEAFDYLVGVAKYDYNPLAPSALYLLRRYPGQRTVIFLESRLLSEKPVIRRHALSSLGEIDRQSAAKNARKLLDDRDASVRSAAIMVTGQLGDRTSAGRLQEFLESRDYTLRLLAAWALIQCGEHKIGVDELCILARLDESSLATRAMLALKDEQDVATIRVFFDNLFSRWEKTQVTAAAMLYNLPESLRRKTLETYPPEREAAILRRLEIIGYLIGKEKFPQNCAALLSSVDPVERNFAFRGLVKENRIVDLPVFISLLDREQGEAREQVVLLLLAAAKKHALPPAPDKSSSAKEWRKWWLRQYRTVAASNTRAILATPDGQTLEVSSGQSLEFDAKITRIIPGRGEDMQEGAKVEIICDGNPALL